MAKVGIVGGTFDPIHNGHLLIGNEVRHALGLDEMWYMPNHIPPHKEGGTSASVEARLEMIRLAIKDEPAFALAMDELERQGPSYTYDTILMLRDKYPEHTFYFIIGGDMVEYLPKWYHVDELVEMVQFVGVTRPGYELDTPYPVIPVAIPEFAVSSSLIRERVHNRETIAYLVPRDIQRYIGEMKLYE